jgi:hypothetical protein
MILLVLLLFASALLPHKLPHRNNREQIDESILGMASTALGREKGNCALPGTPSPKPTTTAKSRATTKPKPRTKSWPFTQKN